MKKLVPFISLLLAGSVQAQIYVQHEVSIDNSVGINHELVGDIEYNPSTNSYRSAHKTDRGMAVYTYDEITGAVTDVRAMYPTSGNTNLYPITIVDNTAMTYILYGYNVAGMDRYGVLKYNNVSNTLGWIKYLNLSTSNEMVVPTDMHIDINTGDVYITGNMQNVTTQEYDFFAARVDNSGNLMWHMEYPDANWHDKAYSIFYYSDSEIYIGVTSYSVDLTNPITKGHVIQIDNNGAIQQNIALVNTKYNDCDKRDILTTSVKRLNEEIFVFNTSLSNHTPGFHSLFKFDLSLNVTDYKYIYPGPGNWFFDPLFEFSDYGTIINLSGDARVLNLTEGYVHSNYTTSGFLHTGSFRYPLTYNDFSFFGLKHIRTSWSSNQNELMAVMDNDNNPAQFHMIKSGERGQLETMCDIVTDYKSADCEYTLQRPRFYPQQWIASFVKLPNFMISPIVDNVTVTCDNSCPDCKSADTNPTRISVYPNPAHDYLYIESKSMNYASFRITDLSGKVHLAGQLNGPVEISHLSNGIYMIEIIASDFIHREKWIKS